MPDSESSAAHLLRCAASTTAAQGPWAGGRHAIVVETTPLDADGNASGGDVEARAFARRGPTWGAPAVAH
eukprot:10154734-Lingulodinium_polyedra.AAC.1